ncbi:uncharacterized protein C8Q71DRAFT_748368 [Rhodofomes roseus]|uniref:Methyltransferase family protein n=1 Tax=Rhodofomes roseus TaxID=34475 RepID=A0ABQ8KMT4_9APHY|nr:uncharacterized protein C8Q71DRAFT_748368 [Rhodofomes roseus]KAH9839180.1 hypothetical protein C8Q71DRAFT_748368 [Rhodofomes roseus]
MIDSAEGECPAHRHGGLHLGMLRPHSRAWGSCRPHTVRDDVRAALLCALKSMSADSIPADRAFYEKLYYLHPEELAFFTAQTGITDEEELKQHIMSVQADALKVTPYTCIRAFAFTKLVASRIPAYEQAIKLGKEREGAILLDIGCCFGVDVRKAVADGFPTENAIGSDLHPEYWDLGHKLFKTTANEFPAHFLGGDAFESAFFESGPVLDSPPATPAPALASLKTLTPLNGHVSVIHASSFFHLFTEEKQLELARKLAGLLSPVPGSMIFGMHAGLPEKGLWTERSAMRNGQQMFCHSPESWRGLWDGNVFAKGKVKVQVALKEARERMLLWSVTRL